MTCCTQMHTLTNLLSSLKQRQPAEMAYTGLPSDWYLREHIMYSFSHPHVMSRLERLMGTNIVVLTDRKYMLELQRRIQEEHVNSIKERIRQREKEELDREKCLILMGKIPLENAPQELVEHPVFRITQMVNGFINEMNINSKQKGQKKGPAGEDHCSATNDLLRARPWQRKVSVAPPHAERSLHYNKDDDLDSEIVSVEDEEKEEKDSNEEGEEMEEELTGQERRAKESEDRKRMNEETEIQNGYMITDSEYERLHYETNHVKAMWELETVEDLYEMADQVVKDVVAHRPNENDSNETQPASAVEMPMKEKPQMREEPQEPEIQNDKTIATKAPKRTPSTTKEQSGKHRFRWVRKR